MLRQLLDAIRYSIIDFFDVSWPAVAAALVAVLSLSVCAYIRTVYGVGAYRALEWALLAGALLAIAAGRHFTRR